MTDDDRRALVEQWLKEHDYTMITRERLGELEGRIRHLRQRCLDQDDRAAATAKQHAAEIDHFTYEMQRLTDRSAAEIRRLTDKARELQRTLAERDEQLAHAQANWLRAANRAGQPNQEATS